MIDFDITVLPNPAQDAIRILSEAENSRRYYTKIIAGSHAHYQKFGTHGDIVVLSSTMIDILVISPAWIQTPISVKPETCIYHLVRYGTLQAIEVFVDFTTTGYTAKYFSSPDEILNYYKGPRRAKILKDLLPPRSIL